MRFCHAWPDGVKAGFPCPVGVAPFIKAVREGSRMKTLHTYVMGGFAGAHEIASLLFSFASDIDLGPHETARVLLNSLSDTEKPGPLELTMAGLETYKATLAGSTDSEDTALLAALNHPMPEGRLSYLRQQVDGWYAAIRQAAIQSNWPCHGLSVGMAPVLPDGDTPFAVPVATVIDWLRSSGQPAFFARHLEEVFHATQERFGDVPVSKDTESGNSNDGPVKRKAPDAFVAVLISLIGEISKRAEQAGVSFSPSAMPGRKQDFLVVAAKYDQLLDKPMGTFDDYLSGLVRFCRGARETDFYQRLFPEFFK